MATRNDRAEATRQRIIRVALDLLLERELEDVTLAEIAAASDVSHQTVLNHFGSKQGVARAAAELFRQQTGQARRVPSGDARAALRALLGEYERMGDAGFRWAASAAVNEEYGDLLDEARAQHQAWLAEVYADRLPASGAARRRALHGLHAATDIYTWRLLRRDLELSRAQTEKIVGDLVAGILEGAQR